MDFSPDLQAYVCGPAPLVELIRQQLVAIRHEFFGPERVARRDDRPNAGVCTGAAAIRFARML